MYTRARVPLLLAASQSKHPAEHIQHTLSLCNLHRSYFTRSERAHQLLLYILFVCLCIWRSIRIHQASCFFSHSDSPTAQTKYFPGIHFLLYACIYLLVCCIAFSFGVWELSKAIWLYTLAAVYAFLFHLLVMRTPPLGGEQSNQELK